MFLESEILSTGNLGCNRNDALVGQAFFDISSSASLWMAWIWGLDIFACSPF